MLKHHIRLADLPNWRELTNCERWHAGYLARTLSDSGVVKEWRPGCIHQVMMNHTILDSSEKQMLAYARDSLLCALTHHEVKYVFRALLQAAEYVGKLEGMGVSHSLHDTWRTAKSRVEGMVLS